MQYMLIHTHTPENCFVGRPEDRRKCFADLKANFAKANVTVKGFYSSAPSHTYYVILEANDQIALQTSLSPLFRLGDGQLIPIMERTIDNMATS
jgi:ketosteroid isomerase-like protein